MIINELLVEKYRTQRLLDDLAGHDLTRYVSDGHERVVALAAKLGLKLRYGSPGGVSPMRTIAGGGATPSLRAEQR